MPKGNVNREETIARRDRVYAAITRGKTYREILAAEQLSDDALTDHLKAIHKRLEEWSAKNQNRALIAAIATYQRVIDTAWTGYEEAWEIQRKWLAGDYDRTDRATRTVGISVSSDSPGGDDGEAEEGGDGVTITPQLHIVRKAPTLRLEMQTYLQTIINATKELTKLAGLDKVDVTVHGDLLLRRYEGVDITTV